MQNQQNQNSQSGTSAKTAKEKNFSTTDSQNQKTSDISAEATKESAEDTAKGLYDQAKGTAGQAFGAATKKAQSAIEEKKTNLASGLTSVADTLHQVSDTLRETDEQTGITELTAKYGDQLARQIKQVSDYFERKDPREMLRDVENFGRRNPEIFLGAAFTLGLLAARFFKTSGTGQTSTSSGRKLQSGETSNQKSESKVNTIKTSDNRSVTSNNTTSGTVNKL